jgi:hypothetical protein
MRQVAALALSFNHQRVANVPEHSPPSTRLMRCACIAKRLLPRIIGAREPSLEYELAPWEQVLSV